MSDLPTPGNKPPLWPERDTTFDGIRRAEFWAGIAFCVLIVATWVAMVVVVVTRPVNP